MLIVTPANTTEFLMESQIKEAHRKEFIKETESRLSFDEMLAEEQRKLDVNYIKAMAVLGGR